VSKAAVFDIITPDLENGPIAASAEVLTLLNDCLRSFPNLADNYEVHISHSQSRIDPIIFRARGLHFLSVVDLALNRIPNDLRPAVVDIINQSKSSPSQKRALLLKKGLLRSTTDELEVLTEVGKILRLLSVRDDQSLMVCVLQKMTWMCYGLNWRGSRRRCSR
jgi:translation initiation factor 2-alpha kinase 4